MNDPTMNPHGMLPGSHERGYGPECRCGAEWSRWLDTCAVQHEKLLSILTADRS